jgi:hypothetical protein
VYYLSYIQVLVYWDPDVTEITHKTVVSPKQFFVIEFLLSAWGGGGGGVGVGVVGPVWVDCWAGMGQATQIRPWTYWPFELLTFWLTDLLKFWSTDLLIYWPFDLLTFWSTDLFTYQPWPLEELTPWRVGLLHTTKVTICPLITNKFNFWREGEQGGVKGGAKKKEE